MKNTFIPSRENSQWFVVDAEGQKLGRLSTTVAQVLRGKHKASYTPYLDMGDYVVIINAEKIEVSGKKETQKLYRRHSGYPGGLTTETLKALRSRIPERIIEIPGRDDDSGARRVACDGADASELRGAMQPVAPLGRVHVHARAGIICFRLKTKQCRTITQPPNRLLA